MISRLTIHRHVGLIFVFVLVACGTLPAEVSPANTAISTIIQTLSFTPIPQTPTNPSITSTPTVSFSVSSPPDGLRMAYILDGNLFFQEGDNPAVQLTHSGEDWQPIFSEDGEKLVFLRGKEIYSLNIDDSQEKVLVTNKLVRTIDTSYSETTGFHRLTIVPGTHLLLFATHQSDIGKWNNDLLVVDIDTAQIKRLLPPNQVSDFYVSPNGKSVAIDKIGQIDVINTEGKTINRNLLTYTPSEPIFLPPDIHWMPDSTGLTVILPVPTYYEGNEPPDYTVWRYELNGNPGVEVSLDPLPRDHNIAKVSPDGNWILYYNDEQHASYVGNLDTGHTELYESQFYVYHYDWSWSPDSAHFIYMTARKLYLGSPTGSPLLIRRGGFLGWVDSNRYLYYADKTIVLGDIGGEEKAIFTGAHDFFQDATVFTFILPEPQ